MNTDNKFNAEGNRVILDKYFKNPNYVEGGAESEYITGVIKEISFDSKRKMMSKIVEQNGLVSYTKGAPDYLIKKCKFIKINGKICDFDANFQEKIKKINDEMTDNALRVIAFCEKQKNT